MHISEATVVDVRGPITAQRLRLLSLLDSLDGARWAAPTAAPLWRVKDIALHLATLDLTEPSSVYWAGAAPLWFDLAREFTERWVHYRQIRDATCPAADGKPDEYLPLVLRTFIWGFPHQYSEAAPDGTTIGLLVPGIGDWTLTRAGAGWSLDEGQATAPAATLRIGGEAAWRLLTGARYDTSQVRLSGDRALAEPLLRVRGIIV